MKAYLSTIMSQVPDTAQHYIECDTESCGNISEFYCNTCHQRTCDLCRETHQKQNREHEIVLYQERKRKLPSEKCRIHPTKDIDVYCDDCQDPVCSTCFALDHSDHVNSDLETIYNDILQQCKKELTYIWKTVIPKAKGDVKSLGEKREYVKKEIPKLRLSMKKRADELKEAVDTILADHNKKMDEIENSVLVDLEEKQKKTEDYINYLEKMTSDYESTMPSIKPTELVKFHTDISLSSLKMPYLSKPNLPIFTPDTLNEEEIATQFGEIEINSLEEMKRSSSVTEVNRLTLPGHRILHLSPLASDKFWVSDAFGTLIQSDMEGNLLQKISTNIKFILGYHTVTKEGELLHTDRENRVIYRVTSDMSTNKLISTGDWEPEAIYSSHINGHLLVGMRRENTTKITRYSRGGKKLLDIQLDDKGHTLYHNIFFITENINGDICTSHSLVRKVVVVTRLGEYRFSYYGHQFQSGFCPYGICTDVLGHILVCNGYEDIGNSFSVHMLDMDGQFLSFLLTPGQCPPDPCALCIDNLHNLWVGRLNIFSPTITVFKYLQNTKR